MCLFMVGSGNGHIKGKMETYSTCALLLSKQAFNARAPG